MSKDKLVVEFAAPASSLVEKLMHVYNENSAHDLIAQAIGVLDTLQDYLHDGSCLLVVDPRKPPGQDLVELKFNRLEAGKAKRAA